VSRGKLAISVKNLGKRYTIATQNGATPAPRATTLGEAFITGLGKTVRRGGGRKSEDFWAIRDMSFDVERGQVVGVIGRNGAGKSTLLKVLGRITAPSTGRVDVWGRVGSLLEVGTGFHPELTGLENIYLNGSILGMTRSDIRRRMDEIVDFAGVEKFLGTPVKRYSSGMYVRLAFAVAANMDSSVLLVDEVLAVGDAEFQRKCLGKMKDVAGSGRTVLFVSHSMQAVSTLCTSAIYLDAGKVVYNGTVAKATELYMNYKPAESKTVSEARRGGSGEMRITSMTTDRHTYLSTDDIVIDLDITTYRDAHPNMFVSFRIANGMGLGVLHLDSRVLNIEFGPAEKRTLRCRIKSPRLAQGEYTIDAFVCHTAGVIDRHERAVSFNIAPLLPYPASRGDCVSEALVYADFSIAEVPVEVTNGHEFAVRRDVAVGV
jgi:lipopolysaccharide transport system ATP-binding protein